MWFMVAMFVISLIMAIAMAPKTPSQRPAGLEDFELPSAAERPIQVLAGTRRIKGPNVLWYGDLKTSRIRKKMKSMFGSKKTTIGHRYYLGMQLGVCHGPGVILKQMDFGKDMVWKGEMTSGTASVNKPNLWGGDEDGGGVSGTFAFYPGSYIQSASSYLKRVVGVNIASPMRSLSYVVFQQMYIGKSENPKAVSFIASRFPKSPRGRTNLEIIDGIDCNPAYFVYELLTDRRFGASISPELIEVDTFEVVAETLHAEGYGISVAIDSARSAGQIIDDIMEVIQGSVITDPETGKLKLRLIRNDYNEEDLPEIGPHNIKNLSDFTRGSLDTAVSEIKLKYTSAENNFEEKTVTAQNLGVRVHKGDIDSKSITMPSVSKRELAGKILQRELSALSVPLASCRVECTRGMAFAEVGDVLKLSWPALGIDKMVMRVTSVNLGAPGDGAVILTLSQDVFGVFRSIYADGSEASYQPIGFEPENVTNFIITEAPRILSGEATRAVMIAAENPVAGLGYGLYTKTQHESDFTGSGDQSFSPYLTLTQNLTANIWAQNTLGLQGDITELDSYTAQEMREGLGLLLVSSAAGLEWICYQNVGIADGDLVQVQNIQRGLFGTIPLAHTIGAKVFAVSEGFGATEFDFKKGDYVSVRMLTSTPTRRLEMDEADTAIYTVTDRNAQPWAPGRVRVNGIEGGVISGLATVTWRGRSGEIPEVVFYEDDVSQANKCIYSIIVRSGGVQVYSEDGIDGETWIFEDELDINSGNYFNDLEIEVKARRAGFPDSGSVKVSVTR